MLMLSVVQPESYPHRRENLKFLARKVVFICKSLAYPLQPRGSQGGALCYTP
jgi:hypothetical protein